MTSDGAAFATGIDSRDELVLPSYGGGCVADLVPALLEPSEDRASALDDEVIAARAVVLLVVDGLGWHQLQERRGVAPTLAGLEGRAITTVAPSTTATALTSISTGATPGEHGVIGYRMAIDGEILNVLRWATGNGDARDRIPPESIQSLPAFLGHRPPVVSKSLFAETGFTRAHLAGTRLHGYSAASSIVVEVGRLLRAGEPFVYAYYDVLDRVAHEYGLGEHYDSELRTCDRLVADLMMALPRGAALVVTADHGHVDCTDGSVELHPEVRRLLASESGEARFRWLHAQPGRRGELIDAVRAHHGEQAWVRSVDEVLSECWLGPSVTQQGRDRLGDVAVVARGDRAFVDPVDTAPIRLRGRHGGLSAAEMHVPALAFVA